MPTHAQAWMMTAPEKPLELRQRPLGDLAPGAARVRVAGCGLCHTDLSFLYHGVKTRMELPLTLGHEISGTVTEIGPGVDAALVGKPVLVPAVLPCGECELCRKGQRRICRKQIMPGNDVHGGFATHVDVPARYLCPVPDAVLQSHELWELAVIADAVSTPYQAVRRSNLVPTDLAIVVGAGGIGIHAVQIAAALGAKVVALDVDDQKLELAKAHGASLVLNTRELTQKDLKKRLNEAAKSLGASEFLWKIFETSGHKAGQETAFNLLTHGATLAVVGFTMDKLELRLSNLMAFDATVFGNWGCDPTLYPEVLDMVGRGLLKLRPFVEKHPLSDINRVIEAAQRGELKKRAVLVGE